MRLLIFRNLRVYFTIIKEKYLEDGLLFANSYYLWFKNFFIAVLTGSAFL